MIKNTLLSVFLYLTMPASTYVEVGIASYYADYFHNKTMANGEVFDMYKNTAAHKTLPFGTKVRVTNLDRNITITTTITDRGPYIEGRIIDMSKYGGELLGIDKSGICNVKIEIINE